ncbi:MAG: YdeI/OmpD-associated family protein [Candidatus Curtissbacteria bacterium]|nr:YdeI/OmpD-associated family protein [Candidatus Curtissbacteria bacterium]
MKRQRYPMPEFMRKALVSGGMMEKYKERLPYQQNDYIGCITRAKQKQTQEKRLNQVLDELEKGGVYMNMAWKPKRIKS